MRVDNFMFSTLAVAAGLQVNDTYAADTVKQTGFYLSGQNEANASIEQIDAMISIVDSQRADLDFAEESANLSQQSIIQQAATSMLMQANTRPQLALSMLG